MDTPSSPRRVSLLADALKDGIKLGPPPPRTPSPTLLAENADAEAKVEGEWVMWAGQGSGGEMGREYST